MAPARMLAREPQHQLPRLSRQRRSTTPAGRLPPVAAHERPMPPKQRPRCHRQHAERRPRQVRGQGRQQGSISCADLRPRHLAAENLELVPQHQQLDVFHMQSAAATNQCTEQSPKSEVNEGEDHATDPPSPPREMTPKLAPFRPDVGVEDDPPRWPRSSGYILCICPSRAKVAFVRSFCSSDSVSASLSIHGWSCTT